MKRVFKWLRDLAARVWKLRKAKTWKQLNGRAIQRYHAGQYAQVVSLAEEVLTLARHIWGEEHPNVATNLNNLAFLYDSQGRYAEALPLYQQALEMTKRLFVGDYPNVATSLNNLAGLLAATRRYPEALDRMKEAAAMENRLISQAFAASSESDRLAYLQLFRSNFEAFLSLVSQHLYHSPQAVQAALDLVLQRKALTAAALAALHQAIYSGRYPHLTEELKKLRELSDRIIHFTFTEPRPELIPQLQAEHNKLQQSDLGRTVLEELERLIPHDYQFCQDNRPLEHRYFWGAWVCQGDITPMEMSKGWK